MEPYGKCRIISVNLVCSDIYALLALMDSIGELREECREN